MKISKKNISVNFLLHLKKLGIKKGDNITVHSDITSLGIYHKDLPSILIDVLIKILGKKGTLAFPLYNYELRKKKIINMNKDFSFRENSSLSKFFFKKHKKSRTSSIFHSHLIHGKLKKKFIKNENYNSFGQNSDFDLFYKNNFKLLLLGCDAAKGCTYIHHVEDKFSMKYRIKKKFIFSIRKRNKIFTKELIFKVRKRYVKQNLNKVFLLPEIRKVTKSVNLKFGKSYLVNIKDLDRLCTIIFKKNPKAINL